MYSDTHFHFHYLVEKFGLPWGAGLLADLVANDCFFALDIGTKSDDFPVRIKEAAACLDLLDSKDVRSKARSMLCFSAGIWPAEEAIRHRHEQVKELSMYIQEGLGNHAHAARLVAVGECGLDHHWNPSGVDARSSNGWDEALYKGEAELFMLQLELAKSLSLPVIVHSREAFDGTLACIDEVGWHKGIIHCYSYGMDEARAFLDRGWHIALGGAVTYTKKRLMEQMEALVRYIPDDRLLLETDAPYLAPVPCRGQVNTPLLISHTYEFIAKIRGVSVEELSRIVDDNCKSLFTIPAL
ncbi:MAG: TatD family hydrolase [Treponema sp.]|nr:TatD family hydrolase [Treponema sp.]